MDRAERRKIDTANFYPHNTRAFAKKFAANHPDVFALILADAGDDRACVLDAIERALAGKFRDREARELAQAMIDGAERERQRIADGR